MHGGGGYWQDSLVRSGLVFRVLDTVAAEGAMQILACVLCQIIL